MSAPDPLKGYKGRARARLEAFGVRVWSDVRATNDAISSEPPDITASRGVPKGLNGRRELASATGHRLWVLATGS